MAEFTARPSFTKAFSGGRAGQILAAQAAAQKAVDEKLEAKRIKNQESHVNFAVEGKLEKGIVNLLSRNFSTFEAETFDDKAPDKVQAIDDAFHERNPFRGVAKKVQAKFLELSARPESADFTPQELLKNIVDTTSENLKPALVELRRRKTLLGNPLVSDEDILFPEDVKQEAAFQDFKDEFAEKASIDAIRLDELRNGVTLDGRPAAPVSPEEYRSLIAGGNVSDAVAKAAAAGIDLSKTDPAIALTYGAITTGASIITKEQRAKNLSKAAFNKSFVGTVRNIFRGANLASIPASATLGPAAVALNIARIGIQGIIEGVAFDAVARGVEKFVTEKSPAAALENPLTLEAAKFAAGLSPAFAGRRFATKFIEKAEAQAGDLTKAEGQLSLMRVDKSIQEGLKTPLNQFFKVGDKAFKDADEVSKFLNRRLITGRPQKLLGPRVFEQGSGPRPLPSLNVGGVRPIIPEAPALRKALPGKPFGLKSPDETLKPAALTERGFVAQKRSFKGASEQFNKTAKVADDLVSSVSGFIKGASTLGKNVGIKGGRLNPPGVLPFQRQSSKALEGVPIEDKLGTVLKGIKAPEAVKTLLKTKPEKVVSAAKVIEGETAFTKEFAKIIRDGAVDPSTKFILNRTRNRLMVEGGLSEEQAASLAVTVAKGASVQGKTFSEVVTKVKHIPPSKSINPVKGVNQAAENLSEKMFKIPFNELTTKEQFQVMQELRKSSKGRDLFGLAATATAFGVFAPEDVEAGVVDGVARLAKVVFGKVDPAAIAARATKKTGQELADFTVKAAKDVDLNLDLATTSHVKISMLDAISGGTFNNLKKLGKEGEAFVNLHLAEDGATEQGIVAAIQRIKNALPLSKFKKEHQEVLPKFMTNLPKKEQFIVRGLMNGTVASGPRELVETAGKLRNFLDDLFNDAKAVGVDVVGYRKDYVPQIAIPEYFTDPKNQKAFVKFLLEGNEKIGPQVKTREEAIFHLKRMMKDSSDHIFTPAGSLKPKEAGFLERSRRITLPDEAVLGATTDKFGNVHFLESLEVYANQVIRRTNQAKFFGPNNEKLKPLVDKMLEIDPNSKMFIENAFTVLQHKNPGGGLFNAPKAFNSFSATVRAIEATDLLGYAGIAQLGQSLMTTIKFGTLNTFKGAVKLALNKSNRELVKASAAVSPHQHSLLLEQYGATKGIAGNISRGAMQFYMIHAIDRTMRRVAASTGGEYTRATLGKLIKNPGDRLAIRQLDEMGVDTSRILKEIAEGRKVTEATDFLKDGELLEAMKRASDMTQFRSRHGDLPLWFRSDWAKVPVQFKSFIFQAGSFVNQHIIKEATGAKGERNLLPLMRALTLSPFVGSGILEIRDDAKEYVGKALGAPNSYYRTIGKFRREMNDRRGGVFSKPRGIFADNSIHRVLNDATYALAPGVVTDTLMDLLHGRATAPEVLGPGGKRILALGNAFFKAIDDEELDALEKELKAGVDSPLLGPAIRKLGIVDRFKN